MPYRALYREYRPKCFQDMVGQDHITSVLRNQIATGKTTHAYLLCGTRGTGKTTAARILARSLNCLEPVNGEACGHCEACRFSASENCPDIVEIDAASNNGVENVRDLIETCNIAPLKLTKRVVIVDEVHMLSSSAFNALLKTLEEPPAHLVFILATTESHKLLATIVSRCQRFDFHRIGIPDILKNLNSILQKIGATVEEEGLLQIARSANGGMRDALSLLDQCLSFCGDHLTTEDVFNVLGNMDEGYMLSISRELLACKADRAIIALDSVIQKGRDLNVFVNDLANVFRSLLILKTCGQGASEILDLSSDTLKKYAAVADNASAPHILMAMRLLLELQGSVKYSPAPRTLIETAFIRITKPVMQDSIEALEARIDILEKRLANGDFVSSVPDQPMSVQQATVQSATVRQSVPLVQEIKVSAIPAEVAPIEENRPEQPSFEPVVNINPDSKPNKETEHIDEPAPAAVPVRVSAPASSSETISSASSANGPSLQNNDCSSVWKSLLKLLMKEQVLLYSLLSKGIPLNLSDNRLSVGFTAENSMAMATCASPRSHKIINTVLNSIMPDGTVEFVKYAPQPVDPGTEQRLKDMFGDKLEITNE